MLDTYGRKYVDGIIINGAELCIKLNVKPNQITIASFLVGISSFFLIYKDYRVAACIALWFSGYLDSIDGTIARRTGSISAWGTLMDITFDRIVELSVILSLALKIPHARLNILFLTSSIIFSMTVFLTVGALSEKTGVKSFYYQAGLAERTEGFIFLTFMILFPNYTKHVAIIFAIMVAITAVQRMMEGKRLLKDK